MIDKCAILPISASIFALIIAPLLLFLTDPHTLNSATQAAEARLENRIFWPTMAAISIIFAVQNRSCLGRLAWPPHIVCLVAYLAFAGASVLWAFSPEHSFIRYIQQVMIVTSIVLPAMLAARTIDIMRALFLCYAFALILNLFFVFNGRTEIVTYGSMLVNIGYPGYFIGKNYLGECAAFAFLLSSYEVLQYGWRRVLGIIVGVISIVLVFLSDSKTAFGLASICPFIAWFTLLVRRATRISPAIILLLIPLCYTALSSASNYSIMSRLSYILYHDSTLTGRTVIWDFAQYEIGLRPLLGWGYQSFWLVPDSPSLEAPGWVKMMPNAHNGYYDTLLEIGYVGLALLLVFIVATLHAIGRVADYDPRRAQLLLSLALFFILYNFFESFWMRGFEFLWVSFVIVAAEISRYWGPFPAHHSTIQRPGTPGCSPATRMPRLRRRLS
jgi:exopolysaccharide production protein ExoQ